MKKRLLSILLVACLALTILPISAIAAGTNPYVDVSYDAWYYDEVMCVTERGLMTHTGAWKFEPDSNTTRGMLMTILARLDGVNTEGSQPWYQAGLNWAVIAGVSDGTAPESLITREQIATMLYRFDGSPYVISSYLAAYVDYAKVSDWAVDAMEWAVSEGIIDGKPGSLLDPQGVATRKEMAAMLCRYSHLDEGGIWQPGLAPLFCNHEKYEVNWNYQPNNDDRSHTVTCVCGRVIEVATCAATIIKHVDGTDTHQKLCVCGREMMDVVDCTFENLTQNTDGKTHTGTCVCGNTKTVYCTVTGENEYVGEDGKHTHQGTCECDRAIEEKCTFQFTQDADCNDAPACAVCNHVLENVAAKDIEDYKDGKISLDRLNEILVAAGAPALSQAEADALAATLPAEEKLHTDEDNDGLCDLCDQDVKFYLEVSSNATISLTVKDDYSFVVEGLEAGATVNAGSVTVKATMQNVASMGGGHKTHSINVSTGLTQTGVSLEKWLSNCYGFNGGKLNIDVNGKKTSYDFAAYTNGTIAATTDENATRAAWQELTSHIATTSQSADDSYVLVKNGSFVQIGKKVLYFETDEDLKVDGLNNMSGLQSNVRTHLTLGDTCKSDLVVYIARGTQLAVGQSVATLSAPAVVTVNNVELSDTILTNLQNATDTSALLSTLVQLVNNVVGQVDDATNDKIPEIVITFGTEAALPHICDIVTVAATCTTAGEVSCANDGCTIETEILPAKGHSWLNDLVCINCGLTKEQALKAQLSVAAGNANITATAYSDYSVEIGGLVSGAAVDADMVTVGVTMKNVAGLEGAGETKHHSVPINVGLPQEDILLQNWLGNCYGFGGAKVALSVNGKGSVYTFGARDAQTGIITGKPADVEAMRDAWQELTSYIEVTEQSGAGSDDSKAVIKKGSLIQLGDQVLRFEDQASDLIIDGLNNLSGLQQTVRNTLVLSTVQNDALLIFVAPGTELDVGSTTAVLTQPALITISNFTSKNLNGDVLEQLRDAEDNYGIMYALVTLVNRLVLDVDDSTTVPEIAITVGETVKAPVYDHFCTIKSHAGTCYVAAYTSCTTEGCKNYKSAADYEYVTPQHSFNEYVPYCINNCGAENPGYVAQ